MSDADEKYLSYLQHILENGTESGDRTGTGSIKTFGKQIEFDLQEGFPLLTTKAVWFRGVFEELVWMLRGETNIQPLVQQGVSIWTDWPYEFYCERMEWMGLDPLPVEEFENRIVRDDDFAKEFGSLGPVYGRSWRHWGDTETKRLHSFGPNGRVDQIERLLDTLRDNPDSRRMIVNAWNPEVHGSEGSRVASKCSLPPCHYSFQCWTREREDGKKGLSLLWNQRSVDSMVGLPWNIACYALLTHMLAKEVDMIPEKLVFNGGDCHIYKSHIEQAHEQLSREPRQSPVLELPEDPPALDEYSFEHVELNGYNPHPPIELEVAV